MSIAKTKGEKKEKSKTASNKSLGAVYNVDTEALRTPLLILVGTGLVVGGIWWFNRERKKAVQEKAYDKTLDKDTPESYAMRLKNAMGGSWDGTDEAAIIEVFSQIPNQDFYEKVEKAFHKLAQRNLNEALESELSGELLDQLRVIKTSKATSAKSTAPDNTETIVQMIDDGITAKDSWFATTNTVLIFDGFALIPDRPAYLKVKAAYKQKRGRDLWQDLEAENDLKASYTGFYDIFTNKYAGKGEPYLETLKKQTIERFNEL